MTVTIKEAKRICCEYGLSRKNVSRMQLRTDMTLDALLVRINDVLRRKALYA